MDGLSRYDGLFSRLMFDRTFRERLRSGDLSELGAEADAFSGVDFAACERLAVAIRDGLVNGNLGGLGLGRAFPGTIQALGGDAGAVVERFLAAHAGARTFDGTCRQAGVSVYESFFHWATPQLAERPAARRLAQHELAAALFKVLARKPNPGFVVEWPLARPFAGGWYCVLDAARPLDGLWDRPDTPVAWVAALGQLVTGDDALEFAAVALEHQAPRQAWVGRRLAGIDESTLAQLRAVLTGG